MMAVQEKRIMTPSEHPATCPLAYLVRVRQESSGQFMAEAVGLPELRATCDTRDAAIMEVRQMLAQSIAAGELVVVTPSADGVTSRAGWLPDDDLTQEWLQAVHDYRQECDDADRRRILGEAGGAAGS
jgi:hypothetical protein